MCLVEVVSKCGRDTVEFLQLETVMASKFEFSKEMWVALSLSLVYIPTPRLPDGSKSALFVSKLTWSIYLGIDIMAKSIGCL